MDNRGRKPRERSKRTNRTRANLVCDGLGNYFHANRKDTAIWLHPSFPDSHPDIVSPSFDSKHTVPSEIQAQIQGERHEYKQIKQHHRFARSINDVKTISQEAFVDRSQMQRRVGKDQSAKADHISRLTYEQTCSNLGLSDARYIRRFGKKPNSKAWISNYTEFYGSPAVRTHKMYSKSKPSSPYRLNQKALNEKYHRTLLKQLEEQLYEEASLIPNRKNQEKQSKQAGLYRQIDEDHDGLIDEQEMNDYYTSLSRAQLSGPSTGSMSRRKRTGRKTSKAGKVNNSRKQRLWDHRPTSAQSNRSNKQVSRSSSSLSLYSVSPNHSQGSTKFKSSGHRPGVSRPIARVMDKSLFSQKELDEMEEVEIIDIDDDDVASPLA